MPGAIPIDTARRLARICEMMTSDNDGERAVAARKATGVLREVGWTWTELVNGAAIARAARVDEHIYAQREFSARQPRQPRSDRTKTHRGAKIEEVLEFLEDHKSMLGEWDKTFYESIRDQRVDRYGLTPKQWDVVERMIRRISREAHG